MAWGQPVLDGMPTRVGRWPPEWAPSRGWAVVIGTLAFLAVISISRVSEFLYWQF